MASPSREQDSPPSISMSAPSTRPGTPGATEAPVHSRTSTPMSFEFVNNNDKSQIRSHAMRESWRQRAMSSTQRPRIRDVAARDRNPRRSTLESGESSARESDAEIEDPEEAAGVSVYHQDTIYIDLRHTLVAPATTTTAQPKWQTSTIPGSNGQMPTPYHSLGGAEIDLFNVTRLSRDDQALLHHCEIPFRKAATVKTNSPLGVTTYAQQAYGQPVDPTFDPIRDLYIPIDLSQVACVHAVLAHSASHLAYLRQDRNDSVQAIQHKMAAIRLVNEALGDPCKATSDENISAVMRLITFERYWGTEDAWNLHRQGLIQMLKKRGGISTTSSNWRLEMRIQLITLLPKPRWNDPAYGPSPQPVTESPIVLDTLFNVLNNFERPHSDFLNFFDGIRVISEEASIRYPGITRALAFLRSSQDAEEEETRLKCLFYLSIIFKDSNRSDFDLSLLNDSLQMTENVWSNDVQSLRWLLLQGMGRGPEDLEGLRRAEELGQVARLLKECPWRRMEDRLLSILLGRTSEGHDPTWEPSILLNDPASI